MARSSQYPPSVDPGAPIEPPTPKGWQRLTFGELLDVVERPVALDADRVYQLVNAKRSRGGITPREQLRGSDIRVKSQFRIEAGDFLISKRQIVHGACGVVPEKLAGAVVSNEYVTLRPKTSLDIDYLRHLSSTPYFQRTCFHSSVGVDVEKMVFKLDQWLRYSIPIPPLAEQRKIAASLSSMDDTISKTQGVIEQINVVKQNLLRELLTKGLPRRHKDFKETEIGIIPSEWRVVTIGETVDILDNRRKPLNSTERAQMYGPYPYYGANGQVDSINQWIFDEPLVLVAEDGGYFDEYVDHPISYKVEGKCWVNNHAHVLRARDSLSRDWLHYALVHRDIRPYINSGTRSKLNQADLRRIPIPLPSIKEQHQSCSVLDAVDARLAVEQLARSQLGVAKQQLLMALLSGRRRTNPCAEAA